MKQIFFNRIPSLLNIIPIAVLILLLFWPQYVTVIIASTMFFSLIELLLGNYIENGITKLHKTTNYRAISLSHWVTLFITSLIYIAFIYITNNESFAWLITLLYITNAIIFDIKLLRLIKKGI
jgi:hypothetical protein